MILNIFNMLNQNNSNAPFSMMLTVISIGITLFLVYGFKVFVMKSQTEFKEKFEKEGYNFDLQWQFPAGKVEIDSQKNILWVSTHGNKLIDISEIREFKLIKSTFEISNIYIKTKKELLKYPISSGRRMSKTLLSEQNSKINTNFEEIKNYITEHQIKES